MENDLKISDIGEFDLIESIKDGCLYSPGKVMKGIGDDCAVFGPYDGNLHLITTDMLVEDVHFILGKVDPEDLGQKAIAVNLSDIAAMGGTPLHGVVSIAIPKSTHVSTIHMIYHGMKEMCRKYHVNILGGDTSASHDRLFINVAILGEVPEREVLYREGAKPGDRLYVTGSLGDAAGGLKILTGEAKAPEDVARVLTDAHNRPMPSLEMGRIIGRSRLAGAMMDISDGLVSDLRHICEAGHVGARLFHPSIPLSDEVRTLADINRFDPYDLGLNGGEDYRLLVTVPLVHCGEFENLFMDGATGYVFNVGEITEEKGIRMSKDDGEEVVLGIKGYRHFG